MKILWEGLPINEVPDHTHQPGAFFTRLVGVSVSSDGKSVEPLYMPLVRVQHRAGQIFIELTDYSRPIAYLALQRRPPYWTFFRFPWEELNMQP